MTIIKNVTKYTNTNIFDPSFGRDIILFQHNFWMPKFTTLSRQQKSKCVFNVRKEKLVNPSFSCSLNRRYSSKVISNNIKKDSYLVKEENKVIANYELIQRDFELNELKKEIKKDSKKVTSLIIKSLKKKK